MKSRSFVSRLFDVLNVSLFILLGILMLFPLWNVIMTSFVGAGEFARRTFILWPEKFFWGSYQYIFMDKQSNPIYQALMVSSFVTVVGTFYSMFLTITMGYVLSKKYLPGRNFFMTLVIITMYFSGGLIPYFLLVRNLGLTNHIWALILPVGVNTWYLIICRSFFTQLPESLEESAKIDGATEVTILFRIVLPLSMPIIATLTLFYAVDYWNTWVNVLYFINSPKLYTLQFLLRKMVIESNNPMMESFVRQHSNTQVFFEDGIKMATIVVATVPILFVYPFLQKYFAKGVVLGSVKG